MDASARVNARLRQLPSVDELLRLAEGEEVPRWALLAAARTELESARERLRRAGDANVLDPAELVPGVRARAERLARAHPRRVLNATGVVLHTNLGRAPLAAEAADAVREIAAGYSDLELELESGERGSRLDRVCQELELLSGAEAALVVNNNAAGVFLAMEALAAGREVVLSRGELIEIGGSFRVPDILASSRARLREVGTTNRTHLADYRQAIGPETGLILKVHRSNFEIRGFTREVGLAELGELAREHDLPLLYDSGSGTFADLRPHGIAEPPAPLALREGADLVLMSGDKLLGGPQAGIAIGRRDLVMRMRKHPLARALRVDKMQLAALDWTLRALLAGEPRRIPVLRMLTEPLDALEARAHALCESLRGMALGQVYVEREASLVGGGALPEVALPGFVVRIRPRGSASRLARALRCASPPVVARVRDESVILDVRTLSDDEVALVARAFAGLDAAQPFDASIGSR